MDESARIKELEDLLCRQRSEAESARVALEYAVAEAEAARDAAQEASRAKSAFLANMSHELRTPLNGVLGIADLLLGAGGLSGEQLDLLGTLKAAGESLLGIIGDVLDFSKAEAGAVSMEMSGVHVRRLVEDVASLFAAQAHERGVELAAIVEADVPNAIVSDPVRLRQVISNLVGNATKFTIEGSVTVRVRMAGEMLRIEVCDTGIGIAEELLPTLFDPFVQADSSITKRFGGTGLGLAISKQCVEMLGGAIGVTSTLGTGTVFWFEVPGVADEECPARDALNDSGRAWALLSGKTVCVRDPSLVSASVLEEMVAAVGMSVVGDPRDADVVIVAEEIADSASSFPRTVVVGDLAGSPKAGPSSENLIRRPVRQGALLNEIARLTTGEELLARGVPASSRVPRFTGVSVLLVEDNQVNRRIASRMLASADCEIRTAVDGADAVRTYDAMVQSGHAPDVVLMDCQMPVMDGYTAARTIREHETRNRWKRTPIIAVTANAGTDDRQRCFEAGMDDFVAKPFNRARLLTAVGAIVQSRSEAPR